MIKNILRGAYSRHHCKFVHYLKNDSIIHSNIKKIFCVNEKKEEIHLYIMQDKYSVKPDREFRINYTSHEPKPKAEVLIKEGEKKPLLQRIRPMKIISYGKYFFKIYLK